MKNVEAANAFEEMIETLRRFEPTTRKQRLLVSAMDGLVNIVNERGDREGWIRMCKGILENGGRYLEPDDPLTLDGAVRVVIIPQLVEGKPTEADALAKDT